MSEIDVVLLLLGSLGVLLLFGVCVSARRRHDFHQREGKPELR